MLETLRGAALPLKAYDILEQTRALGLKAPMSIYRALASLTRRRLAHRLASLNAYVAAEGGGGDGIGTAFLICRRCGRAREHLIDSRVLRDLLACPDFAFDEVFLEAIGHCADSCEN
ncbi:MAG: transcriptional repressor [Alphaproteobacteria bacterium]|nr:transcriptional repressor [Alphaproteobacteria bacterium]